MIPNDIVVYSQDECLAQFSSERLPLQLLETDAEAHSQTLGETGGTLRKSIRKDSRSQRGPGHQENNSPQIQMVGSQSAYRD